MADKSVGELIAATSVTPTDLFVLEQNGAAKKLTGQVLENWLVSFADGHGGIHSIVKESTSGLVDTYRITLSDTTTFDFLVTNGKSISKIAKTTTNGLVDTYTITYNDSATTTFTVTNGAKGDKGDNQYVWIKYASQKPTASSHSFGDVADDWIGIYSGASETAPTDWTQYEWFQIKGEKGETGDPARLTSSAVEYQVSDSGTIIPSGSWGSSIPVVSQGKYLWTKTEVRFNTGDPIVSYSVARMGIDGSGSVSSVAGVSPDATGNVTLTAADVGALAVSGGDMEGAINMNGQPISGLNDPTEDTQAARKGYVDTAVRKAAPRNLLDNSDFRNPVNQRGFVSGTGGERSYSLDRWRLEYDTKLHLHSGYVGMSGYWSLSQKNGCKLLAGKTYTFAIEAKSEAETGTAFVRMGNHDGTGANEHRQDINASEWTKCSSVWTADRDYEPGEADFAFGINSGTKLDTQIYYRNPVVYEGEYTAETLPEYHPKGYGAELAECQRYYQIRSANNIAAVDMRPTMRLSSPTITSVTGGYAYSADL